nr:hypothetical protein [Bacteroides sp.]
MKPERDYTLVNVLIVVGLLATMMFVLMSYFWGFVMFLWLAIAAGLVTFVLSLIRFFEW